MAFKTYKQLDEMDCGPTCLKMITRYYGKNFSLESLRNICSATREGVSILGISAAAEKIGFKTVAAHINLQQLEEEAPLPCILHWNQDHFIVLPPQKFKRNKPLMVADPLHGLVKVDRELFQKKWASVNGEQGIVLMLQPTPLFYREEDMPEKRNGFRFLAKYLIPYKGFIAQLMISMLLGSLLSLIFPFLTQSLVDNGVNHQNMGFIRMILISQLVLFVGATAVEIIRSWLILHMNTRVNISIISDFLIKLMKLPIRYFDTRMIGDITQRINDHNRIEHFLTTGTLNTLFSLVSLAVFSVVMGMYNFKIFLVFIVGSIISIAWIVMFLHKRKTLDYKRFQQLSNNQANMYELITGMQEIKLNNCETPKRWEWERIQARLFKLNVSGLALEQYQQAGNIFFSQLKNIIISYIAASEVVNGSMTLGMMLSISYIIGQMNSPVEQLLEFFRSAQDAKISLDRLGEIHDKENEEKDAEITDTSVVPALPVTDVTGTIHLENLSFRYAEASPLILNNIHLSIPQGKVTAIVGSSGSGKTTLLKLLLRFYDPSQGNIKINDDDLTTLSPRAWRSECGAVMQEGYIFSDTIARNIAVKDEQVDEQRLLHAVKVANLQSFIKELPLGFNTKIGNAGNGISTGQKQRILIARAVYKNPQYLFFDEATSALDANNEKIIMENLQYFFKGKTVVVIAHRLSTVKNADQIIVLEHGRIVETGCHQSLTRSKGKYFELVKNQLELGD